MSDAEFNIDELYSDYGDAEEYDENDPNVFQIRDPLPPPSASVFTTQQLHQLIHEGYIDLSPPYQRAVVWSREKQITLIDSIFRNFYIPPVLFFVRPESDDPDLPLRVCMDGKQRLSSIQAFFDGQIPYKDPVTKKLWYYTVPAAQAKNKLLIPTRFKQVFASKQITCVEFTGIGPTVERDIFQRVQLGVSLTEAEKLSAISSPYADWIAELDCRHVRGVDDGLNVVISWDANRGKGFQNIAQLAYCIENLPKRPAPVTQKVAQWLCRDDVPEQHFKQQVDSVLKRFWAIASNKNSRQAFTVVRQKVAPIEFVFLGVLIDVLHDCKEDVIAEEMLNLRQYVRSQHKDVRANHAVAATLWDFIGLAAEGQDVSIGEDVLVNGTTGRKRRRGQADDGYQGYRGRLTRTKSLGLAGKTQANKTK